MKNLVTQVIELEKVKFPLLIKFYQRVYRKGRSLKGARAFVMQRDGISCAAKLRVIDSHLLLCSVVCATKFRGVGDASSVITYLLKQQTQTVYCFLSPSLQMFYSRLGFILADADSNIPKPIKHKYSAYQKNQVLLLMYYSIKRGNSSA
ncbi:hypothetical protein JI57_03365 [Psychromonas sp. PRT-SC03]|nr:hypothetical protein JI57_03365 [Psychromonas sp. PRT-SC03]